MKTQQVHRFVCLFAGIGLVCASATLWAAANTLQTQPNILLLVAEDLSPRIGSFGDPLANTPNIDQLALAGTRYTNVFTTAGVCAPSRAAMITGQHQISFGGQHMRTTTGPLGPYLAQPARGVKAFPELLRGAGYYTFTDRKLDYQFSGVSAGSGPFTLWDEDGAAPTAWRKRAPGQPFFGLINFLETHESGVMQPDGQPHSPSHAATQKMRKSANLVAPAVTNPSDIILPPYYPDLPAVRTDLARHYDNIHAMDQRVGDIVAALAADGLLDNTIIIWTTDHGDGLPRAKRELYDSGIKVPMVIRMPEAPDAIQPAADPAGVNQVQPRLVSFVDLAPTVLGFAGITPPDYLHGHDLRTSKREYVFASRDRIDEVMDRQRSIRTKRYKYIRSWHPEVAGGHVLNYRDNLDMVRAWRAAWLAGDLPAHQSRWFEPAGAEQLFDIQLDPHELTNLVASSAHQQTLAELRLQLDNFLNRVGDTGAIAEDQMRASFLEDGAIPQTPAPELSLHDGRLTLSNASTSSIGYRLGDDPTWHIYTGPIQIDTTTYNRITAKAIRYGWQESVEISIAL